MAVEFGAYGQAMQQLKRYELDRTIQEFLESGKPNALGICLGLHFCLRAVRRAAALRVLEFWREDSSDSKDGRIKVPHVGWNSLTLRGKAGFFRTSSVHMPAARTFTLAHYYLQAKKEAGDRKKAVAEYGVQIHASIEKDQIFACQFHPEKAELWGFHF